MADLYLTPAERYTAALGGFYYGDLPEPGTVYTQLIKDILNGATPDKEPKNILARFIYSLYISDLGDPYPRYELAKLLYWKLHDMTPTKSGSILIVTIDGKEDYMTINTDLSRLWYKVLFGSKTDVITEFPYSFNTMQNKLSDWELFGNVEASGTPTPDNPIMPEGTGERTGNLFDKNGEVLTGNGSVINITETGIKTIVRSQGNNIYSTIKLDNELLGKTITISSTITQSANNKGQIRLFYVNSRYATSFITAITTAGQTGHISTTYTMPSSIPSGSNGIAIVLSADKDGDGEVGDYVDYADLMIVEGSTALPYEPFGVKIPISSASTTTPVYLGEVETTRKIKKLVLTGEETSWQSASASVGRNRFILPILNAMQADTAHFTSLSTHLPLGVEGATWNTDDIYTIFSSKLYIRLTAQYNTLADFKAYLAQQYTNGTPVTVWYVLATPETAVVNEPLMRIGDYADSLSRTKTGIDIPTVVGQNTLDVLTTVKPSSMRIEYTSADETRSRSKRISLLKSPLKKGLIK